MNIKYVDTEMWLNEITDIVSEGKEVSLNVTGDSMLPFLKGGRDRVLLSSFSSPAKKGDILLYKRQNGEFVLHRVVDVSDEGIFFAGDIQSVVEGPVDEKSVKAKAVGAERNGEWLSPDSKKWRFFEKRWAKTLPFRKYAAKIIHALYK